MATRTDKIILETEVRGTGQKTVKELRSEIQALSRSLSQMTAGTEEYDKALQDLIDGQTQLSRTMRQNRGELDSVEGSYNDLSIRMGALTAVYKSLNDEAARSRLATQIEGINTQLKDMDATRGVFGRNVGNYEASFAKALQTPQQELRSLRRELAQLAPDSEKYNQVFARMTQLTHDVTEQQERLRWSSADLGDMLSNLTGIANGVVGGISAVSGVMTLFGSGSEDMQKAMTTAMALVQIIQGLSALEELGDRIKGFISGIRNYTQSMTAAQTAAGAFNQEAAAVAGTTTNATAAVNSQAAALNTTTQATNELTVATNALTAAQQAQIEVNEKEIADIDQRLDTMDVLNDMLTREGELMDDSSDAIADNIGYTKEQIRLVQDSVKAQNKRRESLVKENEAIRQSATVSASAQKAAEGAAAANTAAAASTGLWANALRVFRTVLISTGIGALIVALGAVINLLGKGIKELWNWVSGANAAEEATAELNSRFETMEKSLDAVGGGWERQERMLEALGASYETIYNRQRANLEQQLKIVRANKESAEAVAEEIGQRKLQKERYDEFRETLAKLVEKEKELEKAIEDLDWEKKAHDIEQQRKEVEELAKANDEAEKKIIENYRRQEEAAKKLFDTTQDYFKSEVQKLKEKYEEEKALLQAYGLSTVALTAKYEKEKTDIILREMQDRAKAMRERNALEDSLIPQDSEAWYERQVENAYDRVDDFASAEGLSFDEQGRAVSINTAEIERLNTAYGLAMESVADFDVQMRLNIKTLNEAEEALLQFRSTRIMETIGREAQSMAYEYQAAFQTMMMATEEQASRSVGGWYSGMSINERTAAMNEEYAVMAEGLQKQIELYRAAAEVKNLTDEDRAEVVRQLTDLEMQRSNLLTEQVINNNYAQVEAFRMASDAMMGIASSIGEILGTVSQMMLENAEEQLRTGQITEEEYERQFERVKQVQIAQAIINTIAGAVGAFMGITRDTGGWGIALAAIQAAAVLAAGMLQIQQIRNTTPDSAGGGSSSASYAQVIPTPTDYSPQGMTNVTGGQEQEELANAISEKPIRAYVVESDISGAQEKKKRRDEESSF